MKTSLVLVAILAAALSDNNTGSLKLLSRTFDKCSNDPDMFSCLKVKAVTLLDRALAVDSLPVSDYVSISIDSNVKNTTTPVFRSKGELEASLPRDISEKSSALDQMIQERLSRYLETRTIQFNLPTEVFEARKGNGFKGYKGKGGKGGGLFVVFGAFAAMLLQLALGKIALIAGKALLVGKVALLLAGILGLRTLLSHRHGESAYTSQVIYAEPDHHSGWGRSVTTGDDQQVAYRAYRPGVNH